MVSRRLLRGSDINKNLDQYYRAKTPEIKKNTESLTFSSPDCFKKLVFEHNKTINEQDDQTVPKTPQPKAHNKRIDRSPLAIQMNKIGLTI